VRETPNLRSFTPQILKEPAIFSSVKPFLGSLQWQNGQDFCPDTLYLDSASLEQLPESFANEKTG